MVTFVPKRCTKANSLASGCQFTRKVTSTGIDPFLEKPGVPESCPGSRKESVEDPGSRRGPALAREGLVPTAGVRRVPAAPDLSLPRSSPDARPSSEGGPSQSGGAGTGKAQAGYRRPGRAGQTSGAGFPVAGGGPEP